MRATLAHLAARMPPDALLAARRADRAGTDFSSDSLSDEADLWGQALVTLRVAPPALDRRIASVPDSAVIAVLRRWATPVGAGIAGGTPAAPRFGTAPPHATHAEHVPAPARLEPIVFPAWVRTEPLPPLRRRPSTRSRCRTGFGSSCSGARVRTPRTCAATSKGRSS